MRRKFDSLNYVASLLWAEFVDSLPEEEQPNLPNYQFGMQRRAMQTHWRHSPIDPRIPQPYINQYLHHTEDSAAGYYEQFISPKQHAQVFKVFQKFFSNHISKTYILG